MKGDLVQFEGTGLWFRLEGEGWAVELASGTRVLFTRDVEFVARVRRKLVSVVHYPDVQNIGRRFA